MERLLGPYSEYAYTLLRIVAGFLFLCHGAQKFGLIQDARLTPPQGTRAEVIHQQQLREQQLGPEVDAAGTPAQPTWTEQLRLPVGRTLVAGVIELLGGALIMVGLLTSWDAFVVSGLMAFAYFLAHAPQEFYPLFNRGEPAVLFCFIWLYLATRPPGPFALDNVLFKQRRKGHQGLSRLPRDRGESMRLRNLWRHHLE